MQNTLTALIAIIGISDEEKLFCRSRDLKENFVTESAYCTLNGILAILYYGQSCSACIYYVWAIYIRL